MRRSVILFLAGVTLILVLGYLISLEVHSIVASSILILLTGAAVGILVEDLTDLGRRR